MTTVLFSRSRLYIHAANHRLVTHVRHLEMVHKLLLELVKQLLDLFLYLPRRKASLRIGRGVGVLCGERVVELVRDVLIRVRF